VIVFGRDEEKARRWPIGWVNTAASSPAMSGIRRRSSRRSRPFVRPTAASIARFNNAGVTARYGALAQSCPDDWMKVMNINVNGTYHCMRHELQLMLDPRHRGHRQYLVLRRRGADWRPWPMSPASRRSTA
jgi:NAD(P)-dependent dehydrogenase (short-subunit alcohol dehydrogenase family)